MRKAAVTPSFDHYLRAIDADDELLVMVLKGHLVIEALLVELLQLCLPNDTPWKWNFPAKTSKCVEFGFIDVDLASALNDLNDLRNDFAHILGKTVDFDRAFSLVQKAANAGLDFSDDTIHSDKTTSKAWYDVGGCIVEATNAFYSYLAMVLLDNGGHDRTGG